MGNGLHGLSTNSVKSIELYGYSKIVIGGLNAVQTMSLLYRAVYPGSIVSGSDTTYTFGDVMPSVLFSVLYTFAQAMALFMCYRLRETLLAVGFDADVYNPDG